MSVVKATKVTWDSQHGNSNNNFGENNCNELMGYAYRVLNNAPCGIWWASSKGNWLGVSFSGRDQTRAFHHTCELCCIPSTTETSLERGSWLSFLVVGLVWIWVVWFVLCFVFLLLFSCSSMLIGSLQTDPFLRLT